jgi:hypothetical protein
MGSAGHTTPDDAIGQSTGGTPRRVVSGKPSERVYADVVLDVVDALPVEPEFKGAHAQVARGRDYQLVLTFDKADRGEVLIALGKVVPALLVWTGDAALQIEGAEFGLGAESVKDGAGYLGFKLRVPEHAARCIGTLSLQVAGQPEKVLRRVAVGGDYYTPPAEVVKLMEVSLQPEPNPRIAWLNIAANNEMFVVRGHHPLIGNLETEIAQPAFSLADFRHDQKTTTIYQSVREYSRTEIEHLAVWLKRLTDRAREKDEPLSIVICEHADSRVPWEMLVLEVDGLPLGAMAEVTRWTSVMQHTGPVKLQPALERRLRGRVVRYIDRDRLDATKAELKALAGCAEVPCDSPQELVEQLATPPNDLALVFLGCHGIVAQDKDHRTELQGAKLPGGDDDNVNSLGFEELGRPAAQPAIVINACHSARLVRMFFLSYFATSFIGTLGAVDDKLAAEIGARLLKEARSADGVRLAAFLLEVRRQAVEEYKRGGGTVRLVSSFMYVLYGGIGDYLKLNEA